jgi:uncharacterized protein YuzE
MEETKVRTRYCSEADAFVVYVDEECQPGSIEYTTDATGDMIFLVDYSASDKIVSLEILDAKKTLSKIPDTVYRVPINNRPESKSGSKNFWFINPASYAACDIQYVNTVATNFRLIQNKVSDLVVGFQVVTL